MLATQLNHMIHNNQLASFTVIKVKKHICNQIGQQTKRVVVILEPLATRLGPSLVTPSRSILTGRSLRVPPARSATPTLGCR